MLRSRATPPHTHQSNPNILTLEEAWPSESQFREEERRPEESEGPHEGRRPQEEVEGREEERRPEEALHSRMIPLPLKPTRYAPWRRHPRDATLRDDPTPVPLLLANANISSTQEAGPHE